MKKRLRKKYRVGEFQELCFRFTLDYKGEVDSPECEQFLDALLDDCMKANGLTFEAYLTTSDGWHFVAMATDPRQTSEEQRQAVKTWLENRPDAELKSITDVHDAWYARDLGTL